MENLSSGNGNENESNVYFRTEKYIWIKISGGSLTYDWRYQEKISELEDTAIEII